MIKLVNERPLINPLTRAERISILQRALNAVPYFSPVTIPIEDFLATDFNNIAFKSKIHVEIDFWLTEIRTNASAAEQQKGTKFKLCVYEAESGIPVYGYNKSDLLPLMNVSTDSGINQFGISHYDDRQREVMPYLVKAGTELIIEVRSDALILAPGNFEICLCGFNGISYPYLTEDETEKINKSLDSDTIFQTFRFLNDPNINNTVINTSFFNVENDNNPRLILAFGIAETLGDDDPVAFQSRISLLDSTRHIKLTNAPTLAEFLAPRVPFIQDNHFNYLPIEHYFMPFGNMRFQIANDNSSPFQPNVNYEFIMLTRTV